MIFVLSNLDTVFVLFGTNVLSYLDVEQPLLIRSWVNCISITKFDVPNPIINGSVPAVILDCDFQYAQSDIISLVVKWYYNNSQFPIYQWIPGNDPEAAGEFQNRLDLTHEISTDPYTKHRALRLIWPTVEFSGNYMCSVQSLSSEDSKNKSFVVYVPVERLEINVTKTSDNGVNVSCISEGGYPEPLISLVIYKDDSEDAEPVDNFRVLTLDGDGDGQTDFIGYKVFKDKHLGAKQVEFECILTIADALYKELKRHVYHPDISNAGAREVASSSHLLTITTAIMSIISTTFMFRQYNSFRS
ncbi:hypothetical protein CHUAL_002354 [Chamberlinius hualienensis]